jgi:hypothetical protein
MKKNKVEWFEFRLLGSAFGVMFVWASGMGFGIWNSKLPSAPIWVSAILGIVGAGLCISSHVWGWRDL